MSEFTSPSSTNEPEPEKEPQQEPSGVPMEEAKLQGSLLGHQGRCFDLRFHPVDHNVLLSASEDGSVKLWNVERRSCLQTFVHNKEAEALRAGFINKYVCSAGSDGKVHLWSHLDETDTSLGNTAEIAQDSSNNKAANATKSHTKGKKVHTLQHRTETSQVYVCEAQVLANTTSSYQEALTSTLLLTAADSDVYLWDVEYSTAASRMWNYTTSTEDETAVFGGIHRNPDKEVFVFDTKWCPNSPHEAALALSDSTIRLLDIRQSQSSVLSLSLTIEELEQSGVKLGHATSVNWSHSGTLCSVSFGSGIVALIDIRMGECLSLSRLHNGPCYGAVFLPQSDHKALSWSVDSTIRMWTYDTEQPSDEDITTSYLSYIKDFSILTCAMHEPSGNIIVGGSSKAAPAGGGHTTSKLSFLGTPIYIVNPQLSK